jgi:spore germination cell wall hydrolase CwlJ-like protein
MDPLTIAIVAGVVILMASQAGSGVQDPGADATENEALARILASEVSGYHADERAAVAWLVVHDAARASSTILARVYPPWGRQGGKKDDGKRRPYSSRQAATDADRALAADVLAGNVSDPTGGAWKWFEPAAQDALYARNQAAIAAGTAQGNASGYNYDAAGIRAKWSAEGRHLVGNIGRIEMWG